MSITGACRFTGRSQKFMACKVAYKVSSSICECFPFLFYVKAVIMVNCQSSVKQAFFLPFFLSFCSSFFLSTNS